MTLIPLPPLQLLRSVFNINNASVASWSSRSACGPNAGDVKLNETEPCADPGGAAIATGPELGGPLRKGLLKCVAEGVRALNAGEGWRRGDVIVERLLEARE